MNENQNPEKDEPLSQVLREWAVNTPLPPRFQEQVWQRITRAETQPAAAPQAGLWRLLEVVLPRPQFAFAYMAALLVLGVTAGTWAAQITTSRLDSALSQRYVQSIDPYRTDTPHP